MSNPSLRLNRPAFLSPLRTRTRSDCLKLVLLTVYVLLFEQFQPVYGQAGQDCHFPRFTPRHDLDLKKFMGTWFLHEFASSDRSFDNLSIPFKCTRVRYVGSPSEIANGSFVGLESFMHERNGRTEAFKVPITVPNTRNVINALWDAETSSGKAKMLVLGTDIQHSKWSLLYSCTISGAKKYRWETIGIWSRSPNIEDQHREMLKAILVGWGLPLKSHKFHNQSDC